MLGCAWCEKGLSTCVTFSPFCTHYVLLGPFGDGFGRGVLVGGVEGTDPEEC